ncbi:protein phosphatase 2A A subunit (ISS) [Moelleriella libera RCEF 2490]|uniref:Protein phosphatase 2A A subunit (ISS) n=1 Tax=Moelleriella libera RCEF 2490 TaxID=1081109 RepID=A0A166N9A5_9HYPO|nr:protein phosphatase 2A A subunit (ISS) [Moelleriella libera RCEF 2490]
MQANYLQRKTISIDCDTIDWTDVLQLARNLPAQHGACIYFEDSGDKPIYSDHAEKIVDIREKTAISNKDNMGAYVLPSAEMLKSKAADYLDMAHHPDGHVCEDFSSRLVGPMLGNGIPFLADKITGEHFTIQTARRLKTHHGNVGAVLADIGSKTFAQLAQYNIPFHDIHFGKPYADVYIDDLAVNANLDTIQEVGWLPDEPEDEASGVEAEKKVGMVAARDFNTIQIVNDRVVKSSRRDNILGELFFYSHMPAHVRPWSAAPASPFADAPPVSPALHKQFDKHLSSANVGAEGPVAGLLFERIRVFLAELLGKATPAHVIHGDPVFSNAILSPKETSVKFTDVRCWLGDVLTAAGDVNYDLAKVLQSLCGYGHILLLSETSVQGLVDVAEGRAPVLPEPDAALLATLREHLFDFVRQT